MPKISRTVWKGIKILGLGLLTILSVLTLNIYDPEEQKRISGE